MTTAIRSLRTAERFAATIALGAMLFCLAGCDSKGVSSLDRTAPELEILSPLAGASVSGVGFFLDIQVTDDDSGVDRVVLRVNDVETQVDSEAPYALFVPSIAEAEGTPLAIEVEAFDEVGNATVDAVTVTPAVRTVTPITVDSNADKNPSWAPNSQWIAFQSNRFGQWDIFSIDDDGTDELRLTTNLNDDENPAWAPGGQYIAFDSERAGGGVEADLWRLLFVSGDPSAEALTFGNNDDREPAWPRDGASLAFASDRGLGNQFDIWNVTVPGGVASPLTAFSEPDVSPAYSPVDDRLAFSSPLNFGTPHIYIRAADGTVAPLTGDVSFTESDPAWSPGGNAILYARRSAAHANVWIMVFGRAVPVQVTFGTGVTGDAGPAWSPDGSAIAFHSDRGGNLDIYVVK